MDDDSPKTFKKKSPTQRKKTTGTGSARSPQRVRASAKSMKKSGSFVSSLKNEWSLFWDGITGSDIGSENPHPEFGTVSPQPLTMKQIKDITKALSEEKKRLNQRLEYIKREIELNSTKLQSLQIVGGDADETERKLGELNEQGRHLSMELHELDTRLKLVRHQESQEKRQVEA